MRCEWRVLRAVAWHDCMSLCLVAWAWLLHYAKVTTNNTSLYLVASDILAPSHAQCTLASTEVCGPGVAGAVCTCTHGADRTTLAQAAS